MYLTYEEFKDMGGALCQAAFERVQFEAEMQVCADTFKRMYNVDEDTRSIIKQCLTKIIGLLDKKEKHLTEGTVTSFSHDGLSQSLKVPDSKEVMVEISRIIRTYLSQRTDINGTPLLYLGVSSND